MYKEGIIKAIGELKDRDGSSLSAIKKHIQANLPVGKTYNNATFLKVLKDMVEAGDLVKIRQSYKLSAELQNNFHKENNTFALRVCSDHPRQANMADLWRNGQLCDAVVISSDGRSFQAHRLVLAMNSDYMRALLAEDRFKDSSGCPVTLPDVSSRALELLLEWMYEGQCKMDTLSDTVELIEAASRLQCSDLVKKLGAAMCDAVKDDTCLGIWDLAERLRLKVLAEKAKDVALKCYAALTESDDFKELSLERLIELLQEDSLEMIDESKVFTSVIDWANAQSNGQPTGEELDKLLACIRFPLMDERFFQENVQNEPLLISNPLCFRTIAGTIYSAQCKQTRRGKPLKWEDIKIGVKVRIIDDITEFERLCDRAAPGATGSVGWAEMDDLVGDCFRITDEMVENKSEEFRSIEYKGYSIPFDSLYFQ